MMHTDELRAELAELAREVDPFVEDLAAVRHRVARRRAAGASVAVVLVIGLVAGGIALSRPGSKHVHVAGTDKQVSLSTMPRVDALVILPAGATDSDAAHVRDVLESTSAVQAYSPAPASTAALALKSLRGGDAAALHRRVCDNPLTTTTFAVELSRAQSDAFPRLQATIGSAATSYLFPRSSTDVEVFMKVNASAAEVEAVRSDIASDTDIVKTTFLDHQAAYRAFVKLFESQPALIAQTKPGQLPESFKLQVREGASIDAAANRFEQLPGVDTAITTSLDVFRQSPLLRELSENEADIFMQVKASDAQIAAVRVALDADAAVASYRFLTHEDAVNEFRQMFANEPGGDKLIKNVEAGTLPTSFRVVLHDAAQGPAFQHRYQSLDGVDAVDIAQSAIDAACSAQP